MIIAVPCVAVAKRFQIQFKGIAVGGFGYCFINIPFQNISVGETSAFVNPVIFLPIAFKFARCENGLSIFTANLIRDFTELVMVGNMVFKLSACSERYRI